MLRDENGMSAHGGLPAVVVRQSRGQSLLYELASLSANRLPGSADEVLPVLGAQSEACPELALAQGLKQFVKVAHNLGSLAPEWRAQGVAT